MNMITLFLLSILWQADVGDPNRFNAYLILAYVLMWLVGMAYIISLIVRQRNLQQDIRLMQDVLQEDEEAGRK